MKPSSPSTDFYPAFLRLKGLPVLLVGGGAVALQKAIALGEVGARITVVASEVHPNMKHVPGVRRILRRSFKGSDLKGGSGAPRIVVVATDNEALNVRVGRACGRSRAWVNVMDRPDLSSFVVPAVVRQGQVTFAVSTAGTSPLLAWFLAARLGTAFGPEVAEMSRVLGRLRPKLKVLPAAVRRKVVESALAKAAASECRPRDLERMEKEILEAVKAGIPN